MMASAVAPGAAAPAKAARAPEPTGLHAVMHSVMSDVTSAGETKEWADKILVVCSAIGVRIEGEDPDQPQERVYQKGMECRQVLNDLLRNLRLEDKRMEGQRPILRQLGEFRVFQRDLIPLLIEYANDEDKETQRMIFSLLRLMASLTLPANLAFEAAELGVEKTLPYLQVIGYLQQYKEAMIQPWTLAASDEEFRDRNILTITSPAALKAVTTTMYNPLMKLERSNKDTDIVELGLIIFRNILHVPDPKTMPTQERLHDRAIRALAEMGFLRLLLSLTADMQEYSEMQMVLVELVVLLFRDQEPAQLLSEASNSLAEVKRKDQLKLRAALEKEASTEIRTSTRSMLGSSRHARFGGVFEIKHLTTQDRQFFNGSVQSLHSATLDAKKRKKKVKKAIDPDAEDARHSPPDVVNVLKGFAVQFVRDAYNEVMDAFFARLGNPKEKLLKSDSINYFHMMSVFMEFHRLLRDKEVEEGKYNPKTQGEDVELIASSLKREVVLYVQQEMKQLAEEMNKDKVGAFVWSRRLHQALKAFSEQMIMLERLWGSCLEDQQQFALNVLQNVFYDEDFLRMLVKLVRSYNPKKASKVFLQDLVLVMHRMLRLLNKLSKTDCKLYVKKKQRKKKAKAKAKDKGKDGAAKEGEQPGAEGPTTEGAGAAPTATAEGAAAAGDGATPAGEAAQPPEDLGQLFDGDEDGEQELDEEELEEEQDRLRQMENMASESLFNLTRFYESFKSPQIIQNYCRLLQNYRTNSNDLNHAIVKMFHRLVEPSYNLEMRPMFYQLSVFRLFQQILADPAVKRESRFKVLRGFIKQAVIRPFFEDAQKNPSLFIEVLFWKDQFSVEQLVYGFSEAFKRKERKSNSWSPEDETRLRTLYEENQAADNLFELLEEAFIGQNRTVASIKGRLTRMGIPWKESRSRTKWSEEDDEVLRRAYGRHQDSFDPAQGVVDEEPFDDPDKNRTIRTRLRKLGYEVLKKKDYKAQKTNVWEEEDNEALTEIFKFAQDLDDSIVDIINTIMEDGRMWNKTRASVRQQLVNLGLYETKKSKALKTAEAALSVGGSAKKKKRKRRKKAKHAQGAAEQPKVQDDSTLDDCIDSSFRDIVRTQAQTMREGSLSNQLQLSWLIGEMMAHAERLKAQGFDRKAEENLDAALIVPEEDKEDAKALRPLIGVMGFYDDDVQDWSIPQSTSWGQLEALAAALGPDAKPSPAAAAASDGGGKSAKASGSDSDSESSSEAESDVQPAEEEKEEAPTPVRAGAAAAAAAPSGGEGTPPAAPSDAGDNGETEPLDAQKDASGGSSSSDSEGDEVDRRLLLEKLSAKRREAHAEAADRPRARKRATEVEQPRKRRRRRIRQQDSDDSDSDGSDSEAGGGDAASSSPQQPTGSQKPKASQLSSDDSDDGGSDGGAAERRRKVGLALRMADPEEAARVAARREKRRKRTAEMAKGFSNDTDLLDEDDEEARSSGDEDLASGIARPKKRARKLLADSDDSDVEAADNDNDGDNEAGESASQTLAKSDMEAEPAAEPAAAPQQPGPREAEDAAMASDESQEL